MGATVWISEGEGEASEVGVRDGGVVSVSVGVETPLASKTAVPCGVGPAQAATTKAIAKGTQFVAILGPVAQHRDDRSHMSIRWLDSVGLR